ncbi:MAG: hypothetical protein II144_03905 [Paludibacteraceae bacterium]|nr:hypothetical protein [Paludibacteraceae bacterium]MBQ2608410.1 hypothetical protein [Paludibacteraceae bacterium]
MKGSRYILLLVLCAFGTAFLMPLWAQQTEREREQQFTYYWYAARQAKENGEYDRALMLLLQCEQLKPDDALTLETIGLFYYGTGRRIQGINYISRAFWLDPGERWQTYYNLQDLVDPENTPTKLKHQKMILEAAAKANPKDPEIYEKMVGVYAAMEDWSATLNSLDKIDELRGKDSRCAKTRFRIYRYQKKDKQALAALEDYLKVDPNDAEILELLIGYLSLEKNASFKTMEPLYERYLLLNPHNPVILNNYAWALAEKKKDLEKAETLSLRALSMEEDNPVFIDTYAWILHLQGKRDMARYFIRRALQLTSPGSAEQKEIQKHYKIIYKK